MDFIYSFRHNLSGIREKIEPYKFSRLDSNVDAHIHGEQQFVVFSTNFSRYEAASAITFCDGQFSTGGKFFHSHFSNSALRDFVFGRKISEVTSDTGVFCLIQITQGGTSHAHRASLTLITDFMGFYPVYVWSGPNNAIVISNNLRFIEIATGAPRSVQSAAHNLVTGSTPDDVTHLVGVKRLPPGSQIEILPQRGFRVVKKYEPGEFRTLGTYDDAITDFRSSVSSHIKAVVHDTGGGIKIPFPC